MGASYSAETFDDFEPKAVLDEKICSAGKETIDFKILLSKYDVQGDSYLEKMLSVLAKIIKHKKVKPMIRVMIVEDNIPDTPRVTTYIPMKLTFEQLVFFIEGYKFNLKSL